MMQIEDLEVELRAALAHRATEVPPDALARLLAVDYRPRGGHVARPRLAVGALAGSAAAAAATVAVITLGAGAPDAFAGWTRTPSHASRAQIAAAGSDCASRLAGTQSALPTGTTPVLTDTRGPFSFVIYATDNSTAVCVDGPGFTSVMGTNGPDAGVTPAGEIRLNSQHLTTRDGHPYSLVEGHVGAGVTGTTLVLDDGTKVTASIANGWFAAWWPGNHAVTSAEIATASGTRTEQVPAAPSPPGGNPPAGGSVSSSTSGAGSGPRSGFMSVSSAASK
jgi:hypothetical protein